MPYFVYRAAVYYCFDPVYVAAALVGGGDGTGSGHSRVFYAGGTWLRSWGGSPGREVGGGGEVGSQGTYFLVLYMSARKWAWIT